jgi:hypothetical protein
MKSIDFLPESYKQRRLHRRAYHVEITALLIFGSMVALGATTQMVQRMRVNERLTQAEAEYQAATEIEKEHAALQSKIAERSLEAELVAYLGHPWPRTQILRSVTSAVPEAITLTRFAIVRDESYPLTTEVDDPEKKLAGAERDLAELRREFDRRPTTLQLSGTADDAATVYDFATRLAESPLLVSVKLESVENQTTQSLESGAAIRQTTFRLRAILPPAPGQPGYKPLEPPMGLTVDARSLETKR